MNSKNLLGATALAAALCLPLNAMATPPVPINKVETATAQPKTTKQPKTTESKSKTTDSKTKAATKPVAAAKKKAAVKKKAVVKPRVKVSRKRPVILAKIEVHATGAGVPVDTALAVVLQESSFRPNVTGAAGEIGLMQLKCQTARGIGYKGDCAELYDPDTNLHYGLRYLKKALNRGSVGYYNAGIYAKKLPEAARDYADSVETKRAEADESLPPRSRSLSRGWGNIGSSDPIFL